MKNLFIGFSSRPHLLCRYMSDMNEKCQKKEDTIFMDVTKDNPLFIIEHNNLLNRRYVKWAFSDCIAVMQNTT